MNDMPWYSWLCLAPGVLFLIWLLCAIVWAENRGKRKHEVWLESEDRQREWLLAAPDPEDPKYLRCWNDGGGERYVRDRERYRRENPKPKEMPRDSTTNPWR